MYLTTNALVLREVKYKEADRMLTLFTSTDGKLTAKARGALRKSSRTAAATQQLTYSEMTLFGNKGRWTVNEASVKEAFPGLRTDMGGYSLACYFAECMDVLSVEDQSDSAMLSLGLNSLYALSNGLCPPAKIKAEVHDYTRDRAPADFTFKDGKLTLVKPDEESSAWLITFE